MMEDVAGDHQPMFNSGSAVWRGIITFKMSAETDIPEESRGTACPSLPYVDLEAGLDEAHRIVFAMVACARFRQPVHDKFITGWNRISLVCAS